MLPVLRTQMNEQKYELLVILICPHDRWAGPPRNQGATAPTPRSKTCQTGGEWLRNEVFAPDTGFPSCTSAPQPSAWSPTRTTPTTTNRRKARQHQVRGINGIMEKLTIRTPPGPQLYGAHPGFSATGEILFASAPRRLGLLRPAQRKAAQYLAFPQHCLSAFLSFRGLLESKLISVQLFIVTGSVPEET